MTARSLAAALCAAMALTLSACGGGGAVSPGAGGDTGGGGTPAGPAPGPGAGSAGTLNFTLDNAGRVAGYPLWAGESLMRLAFTLGKELEASTSQVGLSVSGNCETNGTWQRTLADNDGNSVISAGDVLTVTYTACSREPLARSAEGGATLTVIGVTPNGGYSVDVSLSAPGVGISAVRGAPRVPDYRVSGHIHVEVIRTQTRDTLIVGDGTQDDVLFDFPGSPVAGDRVQAFRLEKTHRWDEARTWLDLRMRYESPELGGNFEVSSPVPLRAWLDTMPEPGSQQGRLEMRGHGGDLVSIGVIGAGGTAADIAVRLDQGGNGSVEGTGEGRWTDAGLITGFYFADNTPGGRANTFALLTSEFSLRPPFKVIGAEPVDSIFRLQFTRPPADAQAWRWRLVDLGRWPFLDGATGEVPVEVQLQGALVLIKPLRALRYSRRYELRLDTGVPTSNGQLLRAVTGGTLELFAGLVGNFQTPDYLSPRIGISGQPSLILAGQATQLFAAPQAAGAPAVSYLWTQVDGTPLFIDQVTQRETAVTLAGSGSGIGSATVRLTLSLADGTNESTDYAIRTVHDLTGQWTSSVRVPELAFVIPERLVLGGPAVGSLAVAGGADRLAVNYSDRAGPGEMYPDWSVAVRSGDGLPLRPGRYTNAWGLAASQRPVLAPGLEFTFGSTVFIPSESEFEILELEVDASGQISRLAMDFVVRGTGDFTPSKGSVRWNTALPLSP